VIAPYSFMLSIGLSAFVSLAMVWEMYVEGNENNHNQ
jgi:hypothetical protein